jgi:hypothetical protein
MSSCPNCGAKLSCGCQKRTLPNGKQGCSSCATKVAKAVTPAKPATTTNTWGPNRYLNLKKFTK